MNSKILVIALAGIAAVLGSCVPLGRAGYHALREAPPQVLAVRVGEAITSARLKVTPNAYARVELDLRYHSAAAAAAATGAELRYRVPLTLTVKDARDRVLCERGDLDAAAVESPFLRRIASVGAPAGRFSAVYALPKFMAPADGDLLIDVRLAADSDRSVAVEGLTLKVYDGLGDDAIALTLGVFMLLAGWVAAVVGVVTLITAKAPSPVRVAGDEAPDAQLRRLAQYCHLAGFAGYLVPFANVLLPAVLWLRWRERCAFIDAHGREALNFQLSILVYLLIAFALSLALIGVLMLPLVVLFHIILMIEAGVQARAGHHFRYALTFRFLRADP